jgi:hypothetical protein
MTMVYYSLFTERTECAFAPCRIEVAFVELIDREVSDIMGTGQIMPELAGEPVLTINKGQDVEKHSRARPGRRRVDLRTRDRTPRGGAIRMRMVTPPPS